MKTMDDMPDSVIEAMFRLKAVMPEKVYLCGGCLQDREVKDYDVLTIVDERDFNDNFDLLKSQLENDYIIESFDGYTSAIDGLGNYDHILKLIPRTEERKPMDFLFLFRWKEDKFDISEFMNAYFPLNIQMQSISVMGKTFGETVDLSTIDLNDTIIVKYPYREDSKPVLKYRGYYPNTTFIFEEPPPLSFKCAM